MNASLPPRAAPRRLRAAALLRRAGAALALVASTLPAATASADPLAGLTRFLDRAEERLGWVSPDEQWRLQWGGCADLTYHHVEPAAAFGWVFPRHDRSHLLSARLTLTADLAAGDWLYGFAKFRYDDGLHPGLSVLQGRGSDVRLDEAFLRLRLAQGLFNLQAGRYVPFYGSFLGRHDSWESPFVSYPLLYEQVTSAADSVVPVDPAQLASYRNMPDDRRKWVSVVWAPLYTEGASLFGNRGRWFYALSLTNRGVSSRPADWNDHDWHDPTWIGRLTCQLTTAWRLGVTASRGAFLRDEKAHLLAPGREISDYPQTTAALDARYEHGRWQLWSELHWNRFAVPNAGDAETTSWYVEAKYKLSPRWFAAARWNQQWPHRLATPTGPEAWDNDQSRADLGLGFRPSRHVQVKAQYSHLHQRASFQNAEHYFAAQLTVKW